MIMTDEEAIMKINEILIPILVGTDGKNFWLMHNTSKQSCYKAIHDVKTVLIKNHMAWFMANTEVLRKKAEELDSITLDDFNDDIQHVGYTPEACGYEK